MHRRIKQLFNDSRGSLGSRQLVKKLAQEDIKICRSQVRNIMKKYHLIVVQRRAYKVTSKRKHCDKVADNLLNRQFNPSKRNQVWAGDVTYLSTHQGWCYLAVVMDVYSRKIIGWPISKRMTTSLVERAMKMAIHLRRPPEGLIFHSDRGSQYTSKRFSQ